MEEDAMTFELASEITGRPLEEIIRAFWQFQFDKN